MNRLLLASLFAAATITQTAPAQKPIKVFISVDMEGITGVVTDGQLGPGAFEWERFRGFMTAEVSAAIAGAKEAGAVEFVVADSHGNMQNLLIDQLPADITVIRGPGRQLGMMEGIDSSFSAVMFIGYHSATTNPKGVRAHTMSSATFAAVELNGVPIAESGMNAALAGAYGVPVVLVSGDDQAVAEVRQLVGDVESAVVKRSIGFHAAATMTPAAGQALIRARAKAAISRLRDFKPHAVRAPLTLDLTYKNYLPAEAMAALPGIERRTAHTIRYQAKTIFDAARFLGFSTNYRADLTP